MRFYKNAPQARVTAEPSPRSRGLLPRRVRAWADAACDALGDAGQVLDLLSGVMRKAIKDIDRSVPPGSAHEATEPVAVDPGLALRVSELERAVEALSPVRVVEKRRAAHTCSVCGGVVVLVLEGAPRGARDWFSGLCAGCRTFASAEPDSEVLP